MMRLAIVAVVGSALITGCSGDEQDPRLEKLATTLSEASTSSPIPFRLTVRVTEDKGGRIALRCRLENITPGLIRLNPADLPWRTQGFNVVALSTSGKMPRGRSSVEGIYDPAESDVSIPANTGLEGSINLADMYVPESLPRDEDLLLIWSYRPFVGTERGHQVLTGVALLPRLR